MSFVGRSAFVEQIVERGCDRRERVTGFAGEFGVRLDQVQCPSDLFVDTLSRTVPAGEKLKIAGVIIRDRLQTVVNRFFGMKFATKFLLHHVAVLKDFSSFDAVLVRESKADIPAFNRFPLNFSRLRWVDTFVSRDKTLALKCSAARVTACSGSVSAVTGSGERGSAISAGPSLGVGAADIRAVSRAIERVLVPCFAVGAQAPDSEAEGFLTCRATKIDGFGALVRSTFIGQVRVVARLAAKLVRFSDALDGERFPAVDAGNYQAHFPLLSVVSLYINTPMCATLNFSGAL